jgi:large subunit ribosomal protein L15
MLHSIRPASGSKQKRKRLARGNAAGGGTTAGRGTKGQHARTGKGKRFGFEGGQVPLIRRQPKLGGFSAPRRKEYEVVNLEKLEAKLPAGTYTVQDLLSHRLIRSGKNVKILGQGTVSKKFELHAHAASKAAKDAVKKAGGSITLVK